MTAARGWPPHGLTGPGTRATRDARTWEHHPCPVIEPGGFVAAAIVTLPREARATMQRAFTGSLDGTTKP